MLVGGSMITVKQPQRVLKNTTGTIAFPSEPDRNAFLDGNRFPRNGLEVLAKQVEHQLWIADRLELWEARMRRKRLCANSG